MGTLIWGPWIGAPTPNGVTAITAKVNPADTTTVKLRLSKNAGMTAWTELSPVRGPDALGLVRFEPTGLDSRTQYYAMLWVDGVQQTNYQGKFRTAPKQGKPTNLKLVFSSCDGGLASVPSYSNHRSLEAVIAEDPDLFLHLGDKGYPDPTTTDLAQFITEVYDNDFAMQRKRNLIRQVPWGYMYSDHDAGLNGCDKETVTREVCRQAYRLATPHPPLMPGADTDDNIPPAHEIVWGRVRIIMLDARLDRDVTLHSLVEEPGRTRLGAPQKAWLKERLLAATEPLILINVEGPWITKPSPSDDHWAAYVAERQEILDFLVANDLHHRVALIEGDGHFLAMDDGTHNYGTGIPVYNASPLDRGADTYSGPYTYGPLANPSGAGHYMILDIRDDGGRQITINGHGIRIAADGTRTEVMTLTGVKRGPLELETRKAVTAAGLERIDARPADPQVLTSPYGAPIFMPPAQFVAGAGAPTNANQSSNRLPAWVLAKDDSITGTVMFPADVRRVKVCALVSKGNATATGSGRLVLQRQHSYNRDNYGDGTNRVSSGVVSVPLGTDQATVQPSVPSEFVPPAQFELLEVEIHASLEVAAHDPRSMVPAPLYRFTLIRPATGDTFTANIGVHGLVFLPWG